MINLEKKIAELTEKHFPLQRVRRRSNEDPWITRNIRRLWKKKLRIYKKGGRTDEWWATDSVLQDVIETSKENYVEKLLEDGGNNRSFYAATKRLASATACSEWKVADLFPGKDGHQVGGEVLEFFGKISSLEAREVPDVPRVHGGLPVFDRATVVKILKSSKKSDSMVEGDPLPHLIRRFPEAFAQPVGMIFNRVNESGRWPKTWKTEHLTIIPKVPNPTSLSECRNISCTSAFSKIFEGQVLLKLRGELTPDPNQYGGKPKCGVEHMLVDLWEKILSSLEGGSNAAILLGIDYERAFNRMEHAVCLNQLERLGSSPGSISLVRAFLEERQMTIVVDGKKASPVAIRRGSPREVYHSLLTKAHAEDLERIHRQAIRTCYGHTEEVRQVMHREEIETLQERRLRRCDGFIKKAFVNPMFGAKWFQMRPDSGHWLRQRLWVYEPRATTARTFNSPLSYMRKRANQLGMMQ